MIMSSPSKPPHQWLHNALENRWKDLAFWAETLNSKLFGSMIDASEVLAMQQPDPRGNSLPWSPQPKYSSMDRAMKVVSALYDTLPFAPRLSPVAEGHGRQEPCEGEVEGDRDAITKNRTLSARSAQICYQTGLSVAVLGVFSGIFLSGKHLYSPAPSRSKGFSQTEHIFSTSRPRFATGAFGEAGSFLGIGQRR